MLLDFDGTLVPLQDDPDQVRLDPPVRQVLRRLAVTPRLTVIVLSGRRLGNLRKVVPVRGVHLLGLHGWERPGATLGPQQQEVLREAKRWLQPRLPTAPGIRLEDKGAVLAVHHRGATPAAAELAKEVTCEARRRFEPELRLVPGKKIWELLPAVVEGKGQATLKVLRKLPPETLPIMVGDDVSDEMAFAVLRKGLTVHVGGRTRTRAKFWLRDPAEVREFLERLEAVANCKPPNTHSNS